MPEQVKGFHSQIPSGSINPIWAGGVECFAHPLGFLSTLWGGREEGRIGSHRQRSLDSERFPSGIF